jgi:hypothetical protein
LKHFGQLLSLPPVEVGHSDNAVIETEESEGYPLRENGGMIPPGNGT